MTQMFDLSGRVAVVSGAASGMGRAMSLALGEAGADLMLADINLEGAEKTAGEIELMGRRAVSIRCVIMDYGGNYPDGRRQPRDERRRIGR